MESVTKNTIFDLKTMVKRGGKNYFEIPPCGKMVICDFGHFYEVRESSFPHGGISKIFFLDHFLPSFLGQKIYFWLHIPS
jgi:hypothetical protein